MAHAHSHSPTTTRLWGEPERRRLVRLCAAISGDSTGAEDLAQETLLEAWRNAHKLRDPSGADRWLAAIARNVCLRWARSRGRELPLVALDAELAVADDEFERGELVELLDSALAVLPPETREILVHRYVHDSAHAEIGERFGLTEDAVAMRLARGKDALLRLLGVEDGDGWQQTRVWCRDCGRARLSVRHAPGAVSFRCPACTRSATASEFPLENPVFGRLLRGLVRPTAILRRTADWAHRYFAAGGQGEVACTRCGRGTVLRRFAQDRDGRASDGLYADCGSCGEQVCTSVGGLVVSLPDVRRFRAEHPRSENLPPRPIDFAGRHAILVRHQDVLGSAGVDVVFDRNTLRLLEVA
jgi:RNA polymerase sigma factor (sigma-70 family)